MIHRLATEWITAKEAERVAVEKRRAIEDQLKLHLKIQEQDEGTISHKDDVYSIKAVCRMNRKIDSEKLLAIAGQNGYADQLANLFRWKPEVIQSAWKSADPKMIHTLSAAITMEPGRPSFSITTIGE